MPYSRGWGTERLRIVPWTQYTELSRFGLALWLVGYAAAGYVDLTLHSLITRDSQWAEFWFANDHIFARGFPETYALCIEPALKLAA